MNYKSIENELKKIEQANQSEIYNFQLNKLKKILNHHNSNNIKYQNLLRKNKINLKDISSLEDIVKLPVTDGNFISKNHPNLSVHENEIIRYSQTSGSTGEPKLIAYNSQDRDHIAKIKTRSLIFGGVKEFDRCLSAMAYGPWASGLISQQASETIGLTIPADAKLDREWHLWALETYNPHYTICLPSFLPALKEISDDKNKKLDNFGLNRIFVVGEMSSKEFRNYFKEKFDSDIRNMYANTEFACLALECEKGNLHYWNDEYIIEIIDPITKKVCPENTVGEVVVTALNRKSMPFIRYNTKDLSKILKGKCECGSNFPIMNHIMGRSDDMITLGGANIFPSQLEQMITSIPELSSFYNVIIEKENHKDKIIIKAEVNPDYKSHNNDDLKSKILSNLLKSSPEINHALTQAKSIRDPEIIICKPNEISKGKWKIKKLYDMRDD